MVLGSTVSVDLAIFVRYETLRCDVTAGWGSETKHRLYWPLTYMLVKA